MTDNLDSSLTTPTVYIIDDDPSIRAALDDLLASVGVKALSFASTRDFLAHPLSDAPACLVLDVRMPEQSGTDFHAQMASRGLHMPVIFMTGHGDIHMAVKAIKQGAWDFLTKPFMDQALIDAVQSALAADAQRKEQARSRLTLQQRWDSLNPGERDVFVRVVQGLLNKQIAAELNVKEVTVKVRRARVMQKMQAGSLAELVRQFDQLNAETGP
ncbi:response regulator [Alcaligenes ammonioxydans]|jgi:FixJ family two-component response regulator|uniref:response regulator transcription factor n=1 Tax=Alcaligenes TaxID=507 RepID=UPI000269E9BF|nr:response regulator [Alcaligenes ammonioxydans]EJC62840.1 nodulation protein W, DNA-binding response regulator [Alcaligenes faecalis subsp. faecalis NCIB 8687]QBH18973.1 response regulator transcription factor [Alcaligenes faecalis]MCH1880292.1 response regulator [Alcaligenes ammonioxydans]WGQ35051.1 response regulator [Alcaligenes faecalis]HRK85950.1 response regulator [Alcaligenes faecalis]